MNMDDGFIFGHVGTTYLLTGYVIDQTFKDSGGRRESFVAH